MQRQRDSDYEHVLQSESRFRALADTLPQLAWMADQFGTMFWFNQRYYDFTGITCEQLSGTDSPHVIHPDHQDRVTKRYFDRSRNAAGWDDTFPIRARDGSYRWFLSRAYPILDSQGKTVVWCGTNTDITDQREADRKLESSYVRAKVLNKISQAIRSTRNPDKIQAAAVEALGEALGVDRAYFSQTDFDRDATRIGEDYHHPDLPSIAGLYRHSDFAVDPAAYHPDGKTLIFNDFLTANWSDRFAEAIQSLHIRSAIKVPIFDRGRMIARLVVAMADEPRVWTDEEISLVETVTAQTRAAIDVAMVQEQEHKVAEQLQAALQPALPERIRGLKVGACTLPALEEAALGGDFYDVFALDRQHYALVIGDVSGKGLAAAQQLALMRHILRTTLYLYRSPAKAASALNSIVTEHNLISGFVTAFVSVFNVESGELTYCSCGHEPGLVKRSTGAHIETLCSDGYPLGILQDAVYHDMTTDLSIGDCLLLHTDGLSESGANRTKMLGTQGMVELFEQADDNAVDVQTLAVRIVEDAKHLAGGVFHDDVAVVLLRRTQPESDGNVDSSTA